MGNGSIALLKIAEKVRAKAGAYSTALESYLNEIKNSGRNITKEDTEKIQDLKVKLCTELNRHTAIYRLIYGME